jgi:3-methyladenine DNA glycosylase/8-oxoguanine DNA glycosylase
MVERRVEVCPRWSFRMPRLLGRDRLLVRRNGVLHRLLHVGDEPVAVRAAQTPVDGVLIGAQAATTELCEEGIARMRFALGVDDDLAPFHERFRRDPVIGPVVRSTPWLRPTRRPDPFEALAWAICEQLIDYPRAAEIQRRIVWRLGRRCERTGLRDLPAAATLAGQSPAQLEALDLSHRRSLALIKVAREVAAGRVDLRAPDHERAWQRLLRIPTIGPWTVEMTAYIGQGRHDVVPAGDLGYLKLVGFLQSGGDPRVRASEDEVRAFFAPYAPWSGLAATYALRTPAASAPRPAGTRSSMRGAGRLAA